MSEEVRTPGCGIVFIMILEGVYYFLAILWILNHMK